MSESAARSILAFSIVVPFAAAALLLAVSRVPRLSKLLACLYAVVITSLGMLLLHAWLSSTVAPHWLSINLNAASFPFVIILMLVPVPSVLYAAFKEDKGKRESEKAVPSLASAAAGFSVLAVASSTFTWHLLFWEAASLCALLALLSSGGMVRRKLTWFGGWLLADLLLALGVVFNDLLLGERFLFPPTFTASGSDLDVVIVTSLFLACSLIRLGTFPFNKWTKEMMGWGGTAWNAFFMGGLNLVMGAFHLLLSSLFIARLAPGNWGPWLMAFGAVSMMAGPFQAVRSQTTPGTLSGIYCFLSGTLVAAIGSFSGYALDGFLFLAIITPAALTALIISVGSVDGIRGTSVLGARRLSPRGAPALCVGVAVSGIAITGLLPFDGSVSRYLFVTGGFDRHLASLPRAGFSCLVMLGTAAVAIAVFRLFRGLFCDGRGMDLHPVRLPGVVVSLLPIALSMVSLVFGVLPDVVTRNLLPAQTAFLYEPGVGRQGITMAPSHAEFASRVNGFLSMGESFAAFLFLVAATSIGLYFASRYYRGGGRRCSPGETGIIG